MNIEDYITFTQSLKNETNACSNFQKSSEANQVETLKILTDSLNVLKAENAKKRVEKIFQKKKANEISGKFGKNAKEIESQRKIDELKDHLHAVRQHNKILKEQINLFGGRQKSAKNAREKLTSFFFKREKKGPMIHLDLTLKHDSQAVQLFERIQSLLSLIYKSAKPFPMGAIIDSKEEHKNNVNEEFPNESEEQKAVLKELCEQENQMSEKNKSLKNKVDEINKKNEAEKQEIEITEKKVELMEIEKSKLENCQEKTSQINSAKERIVVLEIRLNQIIGETIDLMSNDHGFSRRQINERNIEMEIIEGEARNMAIREILEAEDLKLDESRAQLKREEFELRVIQEKLHKINQNQNSSHPKMPSEILDQENGKNDQNNKNVNEQILTDGKGRIKLYLGDLGVKFSEDELFKGGLQRDLMNEGWYFYERNSFLENWKKETGNVFESAKIQTAINEKADLGKEIDTFEKLVKEKEKEIAMCKLQNRSKEMSLMRLLQQIEEQVKNAGDLLAKAF